MDLECALPVVHAVVRLLGWIGPHCGRREQDAITVEGRRALSVFLLGSASDCNWNID